MKKYEGMFIFQTSLKDDELEKTIEKIRSEITKCEGTVDETQMLGSRAFARRMKKQDSGNYVRILFSLDPVKMDAFKGRLKLMEQILRHQIVLSAAN